jgi:peptidoglycan/LPS O-acetylase OafA/YrhL
MITAFLFLGKLVLENPGQTPWLELYISRFFRITPLFASTFIVIIVLVFVKTGLHLHEPLSNITKELLRWAPYTIAGA